MTKCDAPVLSAAEHKENLQKQAEEHALIQESLLGTLEDKVLHLIHCRAYVRAAELAARQQVLDWGCNSGYGIDFLLKSAGEVSGLDLSPRAVESARQRLADRGVEIQLYDGSRCGFANDRFDVVTSFQVLEHVSNYDDYFSEIQRVLKPGGKLILTTPNAVLRLDPGMKPWNKFHVHEFRPEELRRFLSSRFSQVEIQGLFGSREIMNVERNRVERAKQMARAELGSSTVQSFLVKAIKGILPHRITNWLRSRVQKPVFGPEANSTISSSKRPLQAHDQSTYRLEDLHYRQKNLDNALDLMAICTKECTAGIQ